MKCIRTFVPKMVAIVIEPRIRLILLHSEALAPKSLFDALLLGQPILLPEETAAKVICRSELFMAFARGGRGRDSGRHRLLEHAHLVICEIVHRGFVAGAGPVRDT